MIKPEPKQQLYPNEPELSTEFKNYLDELVKQDLKDISELSLYVYLIG